MRVKKVLVLVFFMSFLSFLCGCEFKICIFGGCDSKDQVRENVTYNPPPQEPPPTTPAIPIFYIDGAILLGQTTESSTITYKTKKPAYIKNDADVMVPLERVAKTLLVDVLDNKIKIGSASPYNYDYERQSSESNKPAPENTKGYLSWWIDDISRILQKTSFFSSISLSFGLSQSPPTTEVRTGLAGSVTSYETGALGYSIATQTNEVFITFDDGPYDGEPGRAKTLDLLNKIKETDSSVRVTFFVVGTKVKAHVALTQQIVNAYGHSLANHSYDHLNDECTLFPVTDFPNGSCDFMNNVYGDIVRGQLIANRLLMIRTLGGASKVTNVFRAPHERFTSDDTNGSAVVVVAAQTGNASLSHNVSGYDGGCGISSSKILELLKQDFEKLVATDRKGAVILLHNGCQATIDAIPSIINYFKSQAPGAPYQMNSLVDLVP